MNVLSHDVLEAILRQNFMAFAQKTFSHLHGGRPLRFKWHLGAIATALEATVCTPPLTRLIINLPPRHLKSVMASVALPAFALGRDPSARVICASYSGDLAEKHALDCRSVMTSPWYKRAFAGTRIARDKNTVSEFMTTKRGYRLATSVGGTLTGRGGNYLIIDDPMKPDEAMSQTRRRQVADWYDNTLFSRLDDKQTGVIIVVMQRLHQDDLVGHLIGRDDSWHVLSLPAIAEMDEDILYSTWDWHTRKKGDLLDPEREPKRVLDELKRTLGTFNFSAQYQQQPIPEDGEIIKWEWFQTYETAPPRYANDRIVQSWDTASKGGELNDYSVCTTWLIKGDQFYLLDLFRKRLNYPELRRAVISQCELFRPNSILIEDKASGLALVQDFRSGELPGVGRPIAIEPEQDKVTRAASQSAVIEAGNVWLPAKASWLGDLRSEIVQFPNGRNDDQADSMVQFLKWTRERRRGGFTTVPFLH